MMFVDIKKNENVKGKKNIYGMFVPYKYTQFLCRIKIFLRQETCKYLLVFRELHE